MAVNTDDSDQRARSQWPENEPWDADEEQDFWDELQDRIQRLRVASIDEPEDLEVLTAFELCKEWGCTIETLCRVLQKYPLIIEHRQINRLGTYSQLGHIWRDQRPMLSLFKLERDALFRRSEINRFKEEYGDELATILNFPEKSVARRKVPWSDSSAKKTEISERIKRKWQAIAVWQVLHIQKPKRSMSDIWKSGEMIDIVHRPYGYGDTVPHVSSLRDWLIEEELWPEK